jgi:hypothetical protein
MIDVKDLMVGNFVKVFDPEYKDITLDYWDIYEICEEGVRLGLFSDIFESEWLEGIEVTKEILKRIGFEKDTTAGEPWEFWRYWDKDGKYKLDVYPEELYCNSNRKFGLHVDNDVCNTIGSGEFDYVHELQNLVRCITGHSLPITKEVFNV